ncbi:MAG: prepilin-type N-terminal cleavage/methylation domain-containing protein [Candidatus Moranbacteria bacterium]|nr:prepilin-type N-terminal cleavage/methylation domain-containing protein [Candidatus Moranbacteria bacterium]
MGKYKKSKNSRGLTLIETMMAIAIFAIGMEGFTLLFSRAWQNNSYTLEMGQSSMAVSQGVNTLVDYLRSARQADDGSYPIKSANDNDVVVYSDYDRDGATERLHIYKSGQNILMGVTNPASTMPRTYPSGDQQVITIAQKIVNTTGEPIFYYYDRNYAGGAAQLPLTTPANVADIRLLKIHLKININPNRAPDNIEMQTYVEMRNLGDHDSVH